MNMEDELINILSEFGYGVFLQGSLTKDEPYPNDFFTFWNVSSDSTSHYDNEETSIIYEYDVNFYSIDPERVYTVLRELKKILKDNKFIVSGDGHSVVSDEKTHTGRGYTIHYRKEQAE